MKTRGDFSAPALALGALGTALGIAGAIVMWDAGPAWYSLAVVAMALPCAWAGGKLHVARLSISEHDSATGCPTQEIEWG